MEADVTDMLKAFAEGDRAAQNRLFEQIYGPLKRIARARMRDERNGITLNTTGLVHETYLRLVDIRRVTWKSRGHFFVVASQVMRRVLIDAARARQAEKRGGDVEKIAFDERLQLSDFAVEKILDLDDGIERLGQRHERAAKALELRYFGGLENMEVAEALQVSVSTVERDLRFARSWLARAWT